MHIPTFQKLHVVSDLHMGGRPEFRVFRQQETLAAFINAITGPEGMQIGLVLNGDVVDFLAEKPYCYLDPDGAIDKLQRICQSDKFVAVWEALKTFVQTPGRQLVINLGNHDVELALPHVRNWLIDMLSGGNDAARGRITMTVDGAGYACAVGNKQVLCIHGNEDAWNIVDFKELLDVARAINRRETPPDWDANAGTRLVIDVMNDIKEEYPFVDLLKPEMDAVVPIVIALKPQYLAKVDKLFSVAGHGIWDMARLKMGFLSMEEEAKKEGTLRQDDMLQFLNKCYAGDSNVEEPEDVEKLLQEAYRRINEGLDPKKGMEDASVEMLGIFSYLAGRLRSGKKKLLRKALRWKLNNDQTHKLKHKDDLFKSIDKIVSRQVDYVIAGHTHLARALERRHCGRYYYNSGTWIPLIELDEEVLKSQKRFENEVYNKLEAGGWEKLEKLIVQRPHVVSIIEENGSVYGQLNLAREDGSLEPVEKTRYPEK